MILVKKKNFEIGIKECGSFYWKPEWCGVNDNFFKVQNGRGFQFINCWSYYVLTRIELFFLKWIFYIKIEPELLSGETPMRYVEFKKTHLELMDVPHGSWNDKN